MNGYSWQDQNSGLATSGWAPLYMMGSQMGYGQQQPAQPGSFGSAPPLGMSPLGQGASQPPMMGQTPGQAPQFPQGFTPSPQGGPMPLGTSTQGVAAPQLPQGTGQGFQQGFGKPMSMSNFLPQQGRQIMGNPTSTFIGGGGIMSSMRPGQYD